MPAIPTAVSEIDRKLHRTVLDSNPSEFTQMMALARAIAGRKYAEFSYIRAGQTEYSSADTIQSYISYCRAVGLLDGDLAPTLPKRDIRTLESFQNWLSDMVVQYLTNNHCGLAQIEAVIRGMLGGGRIQLPTLENVYSAIGDPPPRKLFQTSLKLITILRPDALRVRSRRVVLLPDLIED